MAKTHLMKFILLATTTLLAITTFSQEVKTDEKNVDFSNGKHNAIIITIPYGKKDIVEKELKSELKSWDGKYNNSKGEMTTAGSSFKAMGDKPFDSYAKVIMDNDEEVQVAVAVDLGGAYLESKMHGSQFKAIQERLKKFGVEAAHSSLDDQIDIEGKKLRELNGNKADMEKTIENAKKDIENYKQKIADAEQKIKDNEAAITQKEGEITTQTTVLEGVQKKKKSVK